MSEDEIAKVLQALVGKIENRPSKAILYAKDIVLAASAITVIVFLWAVPTWKAHVDTTLESHEKELICFTEFNRCQVQTNQQILLQLTSMQSAADEREKMRVAANVAAVARDRSK